MHEFETKLRHRISHATGPHSQSLWLAFAEFRAALERITAERLKNDVCRQQVIGSVDTDLLALGERLASDLR
jgi:hypothetical protein